MDALVGTAEAAARLGVSQQRVRALWHGGALTGRKIADRLMLDRAGVLDLAERNRPATRPLSPRNAWTLLMLLVGEATPWASPPEISRLRRAAFTRQAPDLAALVRSRARTVRLDGPPGVAVHLVQSPHVTRSGVTLAERWTDLSVDAGAEVYGATTAVSALEREWHLWREAEGPIVIHVVPDSLVDVLVGRSEMPASVVAVDLLESGEPRSVRAGGVLWEGIVDRWRRDAVPLRERRPGGTR